MPGRRALWLACAVLAVGAPANPGRSAAPPDDGAALLPGILARPLFAATRRPPSAAGAAPQPAAEPLPRLSGTIIAAGDRVAMLVPPGAARPVAVREGDRVGGLRVLRITPGEVVAETADGRLTLPMRYDAVAAPNLPAAAALPQPPAAVPAQDPRERAAGEQDE